MKTTLGTGFAAAVLPALSSAAIVTGTDGLEAGSVTIMAGDHPMPVYRAQPAGKQHLPVVLVVSEIFSVHQYIADVARRDVAPALKVPVRGLYGGRDDGIPLARGSSGSEIIVYLEAGHAFHADYRPSYLAAAAQDGWKRCLGWFGRHGV